jgi:beta-lactamase class A
VSPALVAAVEKGLDAVPGVTWGVELLSVDRQVLLSRGADRTFRSASLGKLLLLIEVARQFESGDLEPAELLSPTEEDLVADSGLWHHLLATELPACDVAVLVGAFSDNQATNVLLRRVGVDSVARTAARAAIKGVALHDYVRAERRPEHPETLSTGTATGYARLLSRLHAGDVVSPAVSGMVLSWLCLDADLSMVGGGLGLDPLAHFEPDRGLMLWNKTGTITGIRGDVGVVRGTQTVVAYAVLAEWDEQADPALRDWVMTAMRDVGTALRCHVGWEG